MHSILKQVSSFILILPLLGGCIATADGGSKLDINALHNQVEAAELVIGDMSLAIQDLDPALSVKLQEVHVLVSMLDTQLEQVIASGDGQIGAVDAIDLFLSASQALVSASSEDPETQAKVRIAIIGLRAVLLQVRIALQQ